MFNSTRALSQRREGIRRPFNPDPGFWVKFWDEKFIGDANTVHIEGKEDDARCVFVFPGEVKLLQSYPDGVRVLDGFGTNFLIYPQTADITDCMIRVCDEQEINQRDIQWRNFYEHK